MKTLFYICLVIGIFLPTSAKMASFEGNSDLQKSAKQAVPVKMEFSATPGSYGKMMMSGNTSFLGEIDEVKSYSLKFGILIVDAFRYTESGIGAIYAENGDYFYFMSHILGDLTSSTTALISGELKIDGGTGKFQGINGILNIEGTADLSKEIFYWIGNGIIQYK